MGNNDHSCRCSTVCIICLHVNTSAERRAATKLRHPLDLQSNNALLLKLNTILTARRIPNISLDNVHLPGAVCPRHFTRIHRSRPLQDSEFDVLANLLNQRASRTLSCTPAAPCHICSLVLQHVSQAHSQMKPRPTPDPTALVQAGVRHRTHRPRRRSPTAPKPQTLQLSSLAFAAVSSHAHISARKTATTARVLAQHATTSSDTSLIIANQHTVRANLASRNGAFGQLFTDVDCNFSPVDGAAYVCTDIVLFVEAVCAFQCRPVSDLRHLKLSGDSGRDSLKISMQALFYDDPVLCSPDDSKTPDTNNEQSTPSPFLATGVSHTFLLLLCRGATETHDSVAMSFRILRLHRLFNAFPHTTVTFPADFKYLGFALGLQAIASAANAYPYSLWSAFHKHSRPDVIRTAATIEADAPRADADAESNPISAVIINSTVSHPVQFALDSPHELLTTFPPPLLHLLLGIVKRLFSYLDTVSRQVADYYLSACGILRTVYRGYEGVDFPGNDCHKLLKKHDTILSCPALQRHSRSSTSPSSSSAASDDSRPPLSLSDYRLIQLIHNCFKTFSRAYTSVSQSVLTPQCIPNIRLFATAYSNFAALYVTLYPHQHWRSEDLLTPKLHCFITDVPRWITQHGCTLARESEQGSESQHYEVFTHLGNYSIPRTSYNPAPLPTDVPAPVSATITPIRKSRKRKKPTDDSLYTETAQPSAPRRRSHVRVTVGNIKTARRQVLLAVISFNASRLPFSHQCHQRMLSASNLHRQLNSKPKLFTSHGRSGDSLACLIREWTSNDTASKC